MNDTCDHRNRINKHNTTLEKELLKRNFRFVKTDTSRYLIQDNYRYVIVVLYDYMDRWAVYHNYTTYFPITYYDNLEDVIQYITHFMGAYYRPWEKWVVLNNKTQNK